MTNIHLQRAKQGAKRDRGHCCGKDRAGGYWVLALIKALQAKEIVEDTKAKINREKLLVPNLIFEVEQFESNTIKLSKRSKVGWQMQYRRAPKER